MDYIDLKVNKKQKQVSDNHPKIGRIKTKNGEF
jgi:hypothetical protein